jgi:serine/threonine protein kinase
MNVRVDPPPRDTDHDAVPIDLGDIEDVSIGAGKRVSLATLNKLAPVGQFGKYHLLGRLAYGGMAEIFLAREVQSDAGREGRLGRFCVVKRVLPHVATDRTFVDMFIDEARLVVQLSHPYICHVYAYGQEEGAYFIAMEWINGMPLSKALRRSKDEGGLAIPLAMKIVAMIAEALDHAHRAVDQSTGDPLGIVHRDVSPQNIMVAFDGVVKLLDFGIAKAASHSTRTEAGVVKGKFAYMSPQQCLGEPIDARSDVFALGVVLYELVDGQNPFKKQTEFDTMRALVYDEPPSLAESHPEVTPELEAILKRAIAKKPEERFQTASEMQLAIERALGRMGEVVTTAHLGARMHELFANEIKAGPRLDTRIAVPEIKKDQTGTSDADLPKIPAPPNATEKMWTISDEQARMALEPTPARKRPLWPFVAVALLLLSLAGLGAVALVVLRPETLGLAAPVAAPPVAVVAPPSIAVVPSPPTPMVTTGALFMDSAPSGASITLGSRGQVGVTPMELALLEPGEWNVRLHLEGYEDWEDSVILSAGDRLHLMGEMVPIQVATHRPPSRDDHPRVEPPRPPVAAAVGQLSINTRPWSRVYVGSRLLGTTPIGNVEVTAGSVRLRLVDRDGVEHTRTITVPSGGQAREFFDLSADPAEAPSP